MNPILTEVTTGATDLILGMLAIACLIRLAVLRNRDPFRARLWMAIFALLTVASMLGAVAHGLDLSTPLRDLLWQPLYLSLGLMLGLIAVAAAVDGRGVASGRRWLWPAVGLGLVFYAITVVANGAFLVFVLYEAVALLYALAVYLRLARRGEPGASPLAAGVAITLIAAAIQQTDLSFTLIWPFDHNGIFHLVQIPGIVLMGAGVERRLRARGSDGLTLVRA